MDHSGHDMSDMDKDMDTGKGSSGSSGHSMAMSFSHAHSTPVRALFFADWAPSTTGEYVGACIFFLVLAIIFCLLHAYRYNLEAQWRARDESRRYAAVADCNGKDLEKEGALGISDAAHESTVEVEDVMEKVGVVTAPREAGIDVQPWRTRFSRELSIVCIIAVQQYVFRLLMSAVMTYNGGYLLSVFAGFFLGALVFKRYTDANEGDHD